MQTIGRGSNPQARPLFFKKTMTQKIISYSLFGFDRERQENCFDFLSYLRSMHICIRLNRILFPGWDIVINIDHATYNSPYKRIFDWHVERGHIKINKCPDNEALCKAMLWRMKPVYFYQHPAWVASHVICRDLDSIPTFREAQMVHEWVNEDKAMHCITDSISHNIHAMGGLVGFRPDYFNDRMGIATWDELMAKANGIDFTRKGSDQDFLNRFIYPKCADAVTEHFIKGMKHDLPEENGRHYSIGDYEIGVDRKYKEIDLLCGHAGSAGFYEAPTMKFLHYEDPYRDEYLPLETMPEFCQIFYWQYRDDLK